MSTIRKNVVRCFVIVSLSFSQMAVTTEVFCLLFPFLVSGIDCDAISGADLSGGVPQGDDDPDDGVPPIDDPEDDDTTEQNAS